MLVRLGIDRPILLEKVKVWKELLLPNEKQFINMGNIECGKMGEATAGVMNGPENMLVPLGIDRSLLLEKVKVWKEPLLLNEKQFINLGNIECGKMGEATAGVMYGPENMLVPLGINRPILLEKVKVWKEPLLLNEKQFINLGNIECGKMGEATAG